MQKSVDTSMVLVSCFWRWLGPLHLSRHLCQCPCISEVSTRRGWELLKGAVSLKKTFWCLRVRRIKLLEGTKESNILPMIFHQRSWVSGQTCDLSAVRLHRPWGLARCGAAGAVHQDGVAQGTEAEGEREAEALRQGRLRLWPDRQTPVVGPKQEDRLRWGTGPRVLVDGPPPMQSGKPCLSLLFRKIVFVKSFRQLFFKISMELKTN